MGYDDDDDELEGAARSEDETVPCPYCGKPVYEDAEYCPRCQNYLSREDAPPSHPWWWVLGVVVCLVVALLWAFGGW